MLYLTNDVAELIVKERESALRQACRWAHLAKRCPVCPPISGDGAMIWLASGLAAIFALVLWL